MTQPGIRRPPDGDTTRGYRTHEYSRPDRGAPEKVRGESAPYFAPLANELRKAGELSQAIALCREHLPKQPGHMSGYIVFGQALYESESLSEARAVFEQALALDPENLIALRHLGDIARRQGDPMAARRWYERVLDADPRNDDIAAQLATLSTPAYGSRAIPQVGGQAQAPTPGVPMPVVPAPAPDLRPVSFTPSVPVPVIGAVVPTPDAALRAVDFDEVNARLRTPVPTPLSVPAAFAPTAPVVPPVVPASSAGDLLDLEAMEMEGDRIVGSMPTPMATPVVEPVVEPVETTVESALAPMVEAPIEPLTEPLVEPSTEPSTEAIEASTMPRPSR